MLGNGHGGSTLKTGVTRRHRRGAEAAVVLGRQSRGSDRRTGETGRAGLGAELRRWDAGAERAHVGGHAGDQTR